MSATTLDQIIERHNIHVAVCRPRKQALTCSTCADLLERLIRALRAALPSHPAPQGTTALRASLAEVA